MKTREINPAVGTPELSIIIAARDASSTLRRALDSVIAQEIRAEIIVVDDASSDDTVETAEKWALEHPSAPFVILSMKKRAFALRARLAGLSLAKSENVIFLDADDTWAGTRRLAHALARKRELGCEIIHFRAMGVLDGENESELLWTVPPPRERLTEKEIFAAYAEMEYPSLQIWNKIYSRDLAIRASAFVKESEIFYFDDKFFVTLVLLVANSWASSNEYIYQYRLDPAWPLEKIAKCVHDLLEIRRRALELFPRLGIDARSRDNYLNFIDMRLVIHLGRMSIEIEKSLYDGASPSDALAPLEPWISIAKIIPPLTKATNKNVQRAMQIAQRIYGKF